MPFQASARETKHHITASIVLNFAQVLIHNHVYDVIPNANPPSGSLAGMIVRRAGDPNVSLSFVCLAARANDGHVCGSVFQPGHIDMQNHDIKLHRLDTSYSADQDHDVWYRCDESRQEVSGFHAYRQHKQRDHSYSGKSEFDTHKITQ
ncbi:hypothetical protein F5Y16DRAFT_419388 [Xylariaceae sp. FL0255]|nr:hypothetical protein F5Y16DRAFT_419388 [Xylariaceae sp. FL0255]